MENPFPLSSISMIFAPKLFVHIQDIIPIVSIHSLSALGTTRHFGFFQDQYNCEMEKELE